MKKVIAIVLAVTLLATMSGVALADKPDDAIDKSNGAPSGPHYNLNIIGMKHAKNAEMDCGNGHRIFVDLGSTSVKKTTRIYLFEGDDFAVLDCNGTDGRAEFQLPNPAAEGNCTAYSVYVRALGKPGGKAKMATCATDPLTGEEICSIEVVELERTKGKQKFQNVSKELLTICVQVCVDYDEDTDTCLEYEWMRLYLFDPLLQDYLWKYDNNGLKLAQLRFYMEETCYSEDDWSCPPK